MEGHDYTSLEPDLTISELPALPALPNGYIRIHYLRPDEQYEGWGLHAWTDAGNLPGITWNRPMPISGRDHYGGVYWDVPAELTGYIIHSGDHKDTMADRRIDHSANANEHFVVCGDPESYTDPLTAVKKAGHRFANARMTGFSTIELSLVTGMAPKAAIEVMEGERRLPVAGVDQHDRSRIIILVAEELRVDRTYRVLLDRNAIVATVAPEFLDSDFAYDGPLGVVYSVSATTFKLWAPLAGAVRLLFFNQSQDKSPSRAIPLKRGDGPEQGVWCGVIPGDLDGQIYQYQVIHGLSEKRVLDPYAVAMTEFDSDGDDRIGKGVVVNLTKSNPEGWERDRHVRLVHPEDAIIYEVHIRDFTIADLAIPPALRGTYEGFMLKIPYLQALGVTHVQLLPVQNWYYGNELDKRYESGMATDHSNYNWGYDPHNYFTPEGWFASNPRDPYARIRELKRLISELHRAGIGVILDVVYNHTALANILEDIVPNYYYRRSDDGTFTNGSGCGNDTASERLMFRKLMIDSALYWVREYHVDGFRFDLMGLHDIPTMNQLVAACRAIHPEIELHGEGWNIGTLPLHDRYCKGGGSGADYHRPLLLVERGIAMFSDGMRDGLIQPSFESPTQGAFIQNAPGYGRDHSAYVRRGIVGNIAGYVTELPINTAPYDCFCDEPGESVNYTTCHDGLTIHDKLKLTLRDDISRVEFIRRYKLQCAVIMTSQGKVFFQAGEELFRSKPAIDSRANPIYISFGYCHNSHDASDDINKIDWNRFQAGDPEILDLYDFYAGMIRLRRAYKGFRMTSAAMIQRRLIFLTGTADGVIAYRIGGARGEEDPRDLLVIFNATPVRQRIPVPGADLRNWRVLVDGDQVDLEGLSAFPGIILSESEATVPEISAIILYGPIDPERSGY